MLVENYKLEIFRSRCNPNAQVVHCIAHLDKDISEVIPYLNAELGGDSCSKDPPSVTFKIYGKLMTVHPDKIAINALKDQEEAKKIVDWIVREINRIWEQRDKIKPTYEVLPKPQPIEILKLLPRTNCKKCGYPTCMVFAIHVAEGGKTEKDCPELSKEESERLRTYLSQFKRIQMELV